MLGTPTEKLIYEYMFPKPRTNDPQNFQALLTRNLITEVRTETQAYYGHLDTHEAKYPGLDYNNKTHRIRLSRFPWHRRLFRAVDGLGLTGAEVSSITRWEGTKWAKEKYEREQGVLIEDTADAPDDSLPCGIPTWDRELNRLVYPGNLENLQGPEGILDDDEQGGEEVQEPDEEDDEEDQSDEDDALDEAVVESIGVGLNARLRERVARQEAGEQGVVLDEEWEQWLKSVLDSGILHDEMTDQSFRHFFESTVVPAGLVPVDIMCAAREGRWNDVPSYLHNLLRHALQINQGSGAVPAITSSGMHRTIDGAIEGTSRTNYRSIRFPWDESTGRTATDAPES